VTTVEAMEEADAILWGATGGPETKEVPAAARKAGSLLSLRSKYDLYANLRPIVANPALAESAPLKAEVLKGLTSSSSENSPAVSILASRAASRPCQMASGAASIPSNTPPINPPGGARRLRVGANKKGQGLFGRQGQCAGG